MQNDSRDKFRVEELNRGQLLLTFAIFLLAFVVCIIIGSLGPAPSTKIRKEISDARQIEQFWGFGARTPFEFSLETPPTLDGENQNMFIRLYVQKKAETCTAKFCPRASLSVTGLQFNLKFSYWSANSDVTLKTQGQWREVKTVRDESPYTKSLTCGPSLCSSISLIHKSIVQDLTGFQLNISIYSPPELDKGFKAIQDMLVYTTGSLIGEIEYVSHSFTKFELGFRTTFALISVGFVVFFVFMLRRIPFRMWAVEQRWTMYLLVALVFFNNPFFFLSVYAQEWAIGGDIVELVSTLFRFVNLCFVNTYLILFLLALLVLSDYLLKEHKRPSLTFSSFYLPKIALCGIVWLVGVFNYIYGVGLRRDNPARDDLENLEVEGWQPFFIFKVVMLSVYVVWLLFIIIRLVSSWHKSRTAVVAVRFKFLWGTMLLIIIAIVAGLLHLHGLNTTGELKAVEFMSFYAVYNLFTFLLAFMYSPGLSARTRPVPRARMTPTAADVAEVDDDLFFDDDDI